MPFEMHSEEECLELKIKEYLEYAQNLKTASDIQDLISQEKYGELKKLLLKRLTFGTAGLRGKMGPGYAAINDLVIIQTSQGLAMYLETAIENVDKQRGVVIGYDNRHNSHRFAQLTALSFLQRDFKVYLFSSIVPTPFVPFSIKKLGCLSGIMITASHNPKGDNGYKVYWSNSAQILPPHDKNIQESIMKNLKPWPDALETSKLFETSLVADPLADIEQMYYEDLNCFCSGNNLGQSKELNITFTALHGVAHSFMEKSFKKIEFLNFFPVEEQMTPDPDFPTVLFPNPEEKNCLDLSMASANSTGSRLILANDPDADRVAVAEKLLNGQWYIFTGNEVGALLGAWLWETLSPELKNKPENCCMISSTVSSKILRNIAGLHGFLFYETLTGFKWIANKAHDCVKKGMTFVFAFEEAIGYMCRDMVLDKDGIHAAMQITKMAAHCYSKKMLLHDMLVETYIKYGYHVSNNSYFISCDQAAITSMFTRLRNFNGVEQKYPEELSDSQNSFIVTRVRDLTVNYDSGQQDKKAVLPCDPSSQMITFYFDNGCEATFRTSGTEPKIKYYTEMAAKVPKTKWKDIDLILEKMVELMVAQWIQPEKNGFLSRPS